MKKELPIILAISILLVGIVVSFNLVHAQDSDSQISDYALDIQEGEKVTANDVDAQINQQEISQNEEAQAAADDGDPKTGLVQASLDESLQPDEAQESAKLVENSAATSSENDNGEVLKDQSTQTAAEKPNEDVNTQDDNKAPVADPDTQPQASQAVEQPLENIQQLPGSQPDNQSSSDQQPADTQPNQSAGNEGESPQ